MSEVIVMENVTKGNTFLREFVGNKTDIIFTNISSKYAEMAKNWFNHLKKLNLHHQSLVVCFDIEAYQTMLENNIPTIFVDQEEISTRYDFLIPLFKHNHQIAKVLTYLFLCKTFTNTNFIYTDVDMVFLKNPINRLRDELSEEYDACIYVERDYSDAVYDHDKVTNHDNVGGLVVCLSKNYWEKVFKNIVPFNMSDPTIGIKEYGIKLGVNFKLLNAFEFTTSEVWKHEHMQKLLKNICIAVHYTMPVEVDELTPEELDKQIELKIQLMKQNNHWL